MDKWLAPVYHNLLISKNFADCRIIVEDKTFSCHKVILACASEYFKIQFEKEPESVEFPLKDVRLDVFENFLAYIYTYDADKMATYSFPNLEKLFEFGDRFLVPSIVEECFRIFEKKLQTMAIGELISLFKLGHNLFKKRLIQLVTDEIHNNPKKFNHGANLFEVMKLPESVFEQYVKSVSKAMSQSERFMMIENYISAHYSPDIRITEESLNAEDEETDVKVEDRSIEKNKEPEMEVDKSNSYQLLINRLLDTIDYTKMTKKDFYEIVGNSCLLTYREKFECSKQLGIENESNNQRCQNCDVVTSSSTADLHGIPIPRKLRKKI
ncbi:kelch-like protein 40 [Drosophila willistoni]|uniref:kelch-like protein 40 n=1 Tax=Drosophila willistoni TaxID=7260 RepID=UPI000C26D7B9|nr:kelch-like protein 40 [Drosophila willistoni]